MAAGKRVPEWVKFMSGVIISSMTAGLTVMIFLYSVFETQASAEKREQHLNATQQTDRERLIRIEDKLDKIREELK
jgi:hypothetical protein